MTIRSMDMVAIGRISLGPLIISTTTATRNEILDQLRHLAVEREIVANELDHRIKNLFTLVNGLISLSVRGNPEMTPLADTLRNRLAALHHAHGLIRAGSASSGAPKKFTSLKELIGTLLRPYEGADDKHFVVDGDEVFLDSGIVTPLALVFHELATNSTKYGALNGRDGALSVHISRDIDDLRITWTERGPVTTDYIVAESGFGSITPGPAMTGENVIRNETSPNSNADKKVKGIARDADGRVRIEAALLKWKNLKFRSSLSWPLFLPQ